MPKIKTITLGCRFNFYESEVSKAIVERLEPTDEVLIINTCAVTHEAERQSRQAVRKAIRENPGAKVIVTGCAAKTSEEYFKSLAGVSKVILNDGKDKVESYLSLPHTSNSLNFDSEEIIKENSQLFEDKSRAFIQVQNGCDHFCTYCIVPFTRGRSRSLPLGVILERVKHFVDIGFKEVVLSGIDITSYGQDLGDVTFADVVNEILQKTAIERLRISSLDPKGIDDRLLELMVCEQRIMPHFHLSIQSGDDDVLRLMRRRHTRSDVIDVCQRIISRRPDVALGSDFIAGFPSETEAMFQNTLRLIDEANLSLMHVFPYSPRKGTVAAQMVQLPRSVVLDRARRLREKAQEAKLKLFKALVGKHVSGLVEYVSDGCSFGKTDSFIPFVIEQELPQSAIVSNLIVLGVTDDSLLVSL